METPFSGLNSCVLVLLQEKTDPNGKHMEYRDEKGSLIACMNKVYKKKGFLGLFQTSSEVFGELKGPDGALLMTTTSHHGDTKRECRVDIDFADGTRFGSLYDASYGADFALADDTLVGMARRPDDRPTEPREVLHTYFDPAGSVIGTCDRRFPDQSSSLFDFLVNGGMNSSGTPVQVVKLDTAVEPVLHTFAFLFAALQNLRYSRSG